VDSTYGWAVDDTGQKAVGTAYVDRDGDGECQSPGRSEIVPFIWDAKRGIRELDTSTLPMDELPWVRAHAISGNGEVVLGTSNFQYALAWVREGKAINLTERYGANPSVNAVSADGRRKKSLTNALAKWGVALDDELRIGCKPQDLRQAIHRFMGALFSAAHWESENAGKALDSGLLIQEAELLLRAVYPSANVFHDVELRGISGRKQVFPLRFDSTYYDAVGSHPASSASVVKKLVDVRFVRDNTDTQITVIVEDRVNIDRAKADIQIFTQLAHVLRFSELEARAREASQIH
jgi:hypothetical protein